MSRFALALALAILTCSALLAQAAAPVAPLKLRNLTAGSVWQESGGKFDIQLRFISSVPAVAAAEGGGVAAGPEAYPSNNHRLNITGLSAGQPVAVKLTVTPKSGPKLERTLNVAPPAPYPAAKAATVELTATEPAGEDRVALPITGGVPLAKSALYKPENTRLLKGNTVLPLQARPEARWEDGSIKWLLLDTQVDLKANEQAKLVLEYGGNATSKTASGVTVSDLPGGGVSVDTGALKTLLPLKGDPEFRLGDRLLSSLSGTLTDKEGLPWQFITENVRVLEAGPLRSVVRLDGHYRNGERKHFLGSTFVTFYAGKPYARVDQLFGNDLVDTVMTPIKSLVMDLTTAAPPVNTTVGVVGGQALSGGPRMQIVQQFDDTFVASQTTGASGKRLAGTMKTDTLAVAVKDLWQNYPKSVSVTATGLRLGLCPEITPADLYANKPDEEKLYYYLRDGNYTFRRGMMKRHELWLGAPDQAEELAALTQHATLAAAPAYYEQVKAAGDLLPAGPQHFAMYDDILSKGLDRYLEERERSHEYGLMNYGDWWGERGMNWGNEEYDLQVGMLQQYLRTGDPRFFYLGEAASRHNTEIDTIHWAAPPATEPNQSVEPMPGEVWVHSMGHTGGYYPKDYKGMEVYGPGYATNRGHMWTGGNFLYGMLSGESLVLDSARLAADWMSSADCNNFDFGNAREPGWMTMAVMGAFRATRDPYYLNAADIMLTKVHEKALATKPEYGLYYHKLDAGHCDCKDTKHYGEAGFMAGVLMTAMKRFYEETGREQVADDIVGIAHLIRDTMWVPEENGFRYTSCPRTTVTAASGGIIDEGMAFAATRSNDEDLREIVRSTFAGAMLALQSSGGGGKAAGYMIHSMPGAMVEIDKFPGISFDQSFNRLVAESRSPALTSLPTIMPNPDFEEGVTGWVTRQGFAVEPTTEIVHGGLTAAKITGTGKAQNEYLVTRYECGPPLEIMSLQPGHNYRLSAWLRVDSITPGAPAPNLRCATRDRGVTKATFQTTAYDLTKLGAWQRLTADFAAPDYTSSAYVAVNMNTRESVTITMYADDINLIPAERPDLPVYSYPSATADKAQSLVGLQLAKPKLSPQWQMLSPSGKAAASALVPLTVTVAGDYALCVRARNGGTTPVKVTVDGSPAGQISAPENSWQWAWAQQGGKTTLVHLEPGEHKVGIAWPAGCTLGLQKVVLSNDVGLR